MAGLPMDFFVNVLQLITLDRQLHTEERGKLSTRRLDLVLTGIDLVLGRYSLIGSPDPLAPAHSAESSGRICFAALRLITSSSAARRVDQPPSRLSKVLSPNVASRLESF